MRKFLSAAILLPLLCNGCVSLDAPPQVFLVGLEDGVLSDPTAAVVLNFHEKFDPSTLKVKIVRFVTDAEGNLGDEDSDPNTELDIIFESPGPDGTDVGGTGVVHDEEGQFFVMTLNQTLPIGPPLAVLVEAGLSDLEGNAWKVRQRLKFGYEFNCGDDETVTPTLFPSATHFMLVNVDAPVSAQLQLIAVMDTDAETSDVVGQFTNGDRDRGIDCAGFGLSCESNETCSTLPTPTCVLPSEDAGSPDVYPDFFANDVPPEGYSFTVQGCVQDQQDGSFTYANAPVDVKVESPPITVKGINFNGSFAYDTEGVLRGSGTFTADEIFLGTTPSGAGAGTILVREIPADEVKDGTPQPPADASP